MQSRDRNHRFVAAKWSRNHRRIVIRYEGFAVTLQTLSPQPGSRFLYGPTLGLFSHWAPEANNRNFAALLLIQLHVLRCRLRYPASASASRHKERHAISHGG